MFKKKAIKKKDPHKLKILKELVQPKTYYASDHEINSSLIDLDAVYVIEKLRSAGFDAYLVGGSVRDLLKKKTPKDFDISTSAKPEEIKAVFKKKCLLIGRRFRLAHIRFGNKIIEVATFRAGENNQDALITRDNVWGSPKEDVLRRDFTINGLFYDPSTHSVIDYVGGWKDIHDGIIRSIGDPVQRFKQDPVRMIRLLKFKARFDFTISKSCQEALNVCKEEIFKSAPARVLEEILRMLESNSAAKFFKLLSISHFLYLLFPLLSDFLKSEDGPKLYQYLETADILNTHFRTKKLDRNVLGACLLFPILEKEIKERFLDHGIKPHISELLMLSQTLIKEFSTSSFSRFPKRMNAIINFILSTQFRFTPFSGKRHHRPKLLHHKEFRLAIQFFKIRTIINPDLKSNYDTWKKLFLQHVSPKSGSQRPPPKKKRRRYADKPRGKMH